MTQRRVTRQRLFGGQHTNCRFNRHFVSRANSSICFSLISVQFVSDLSTMKIATNMPQIVKDYSMFDWLPKLIGSKSQPEPEAKKKQDDGFVPWINKQDEPLADNDSTGDGGGDGGD